MASETVHLHLEGMSCQHCVQTIQRALLQMDGVTGASVDLEQSEAVVQYDPARVEPDELLVVVVEAGYQAKIM